MKQGLFAAIVAFIFAGGSALAADLPTKAPYYKAPPPAYFSWTGFYIGAHGGVDWFHKDWDVPLTPTNIAGGCLGCPRPAGAQNDSSWLAGVQAGFNYQVSQWVFGVEAQTSWTRLRGHDTNLLIGPTVNDNSKTDNIGTIAARFGLAWDRTLFFVKGGGAWAHDRFFTAFATNPTVALQSTTDTRWGWMIGGGIEYAFWTNWSVKVEYDHLDFGRDRETLQPQPGCGCLPFQYDIRQTVDLVKVGINYRFGGPISARY